jgi:MFS family permease
LPEIARTQSLADWQIGLLAGSFGFARMMADLPTGVWASHRLGTTLAVSPLVLLIGQLLLGSAASFPVLVLGRLLTGLAHTLGTVGGLTAVLQDDGGRSASVRLNVFEFAGMLGILGGLASVSALPLRWGWSLSLLAASGPLLVALGLVPELRRRFPDRPPRPRGRRTVLSSLPSTRAKSSADPVLWMMFAVGTVMALSWSSVSQFLIPLRGTREFGLDRVGVSRLLALAQLVDLIGLLPAGWLADRAGRLPVLGLITAFLALGTWGVGLGSFPFFAVGCALFGLGLTGWMLPLGVIREHTALGRLAWRTGLYRLGVDAAVFGGPLICGLLGEAHTGVFIAMVGLTAAALGARLVWRAALR